MNSNPHQTKGLTMNDNLLYFGGPHHQTLGPYADDEVSAKLRAVTLLHAGSAADVYAVRAPDWDTANKKLHNPERLNP